MHHRALRFCLRALATSMSLVAACQPHEDEGGRSASAPPPLLLLPWSVTATTMTRLAPSAAAPAADDGRTYPVTDTTVTAFEDQKLSASDAAGFALFGQAIGMSGGAVIIGGAHAPAEDAAAAGSAYVFEHDGASYLEHVLSEGRPQANAKLGWSVSLSGDTGVVGAPGADAGGAAFVFVRTGATWVKQAKLSPSEAAGAAGFGFSVSVHGDTAVVGAWADVTDAGASGAAYVFVREGEMWIEQEKLTASDGAADDGFGFSTSLWGDTAIVGAPSHDGEDGGNRGAAYVFVREGETWTQQAKLTASDGAPLAHFGLVSLWQETAVVGAVFAGAGSVDAAGAAYLFSRDASEWTEQAKLVASDASTDDRFGHAVAIADGVVVVGAPLHDQGGACQNCGAVYRFTSSAGTWAEQARLLASDAVPGGLLGYGVAVAGDTTFAGAPLNHGGTALSGAAYRFVLAAIGERCEAPGACVSGHCSDGVCCESACGDGDPGDCQACSVAAGASADGDCGPLPSATPCRLATGSCDVEELCDGASSACPRDAQAPDGFRCDDGDACTEPDVCALGACTGEDICDDDDDSGGAGADDPSAGAPSASGDGCACDTRPRRGAPAHALSWLVAGWMVITRRRGGALGDGSE